MKIDQEYLKGLLIAFEDSNEPHTSITRLLALGFDHRTNEFRFHIRLLHDRGLIGRVDGEYGIGYFSPGSDDQDDEGFFDEVPLRLTASGHDFRKQLETKKCGQLLKADLRMPALERL